MYKVIYIEDISEAEKKRSIHFIDDIIDDIHNKLFDTAIEV